MAELTHITLKGFKSIKELEIGLGPINVLIGPNGAGKSNFISFFRMLNELIEGHLQLFVARSGGANAMLHYGTKVTNSIDAELYFGRGGHEHDSYEYGGYQIQLTPTEDDKLVFVKEILHFKHPTESLDNEGLESGHKKALTPEECKNLSEEAMGGGHTEALAPRWRPEESMFDEIKNVAAMVGPWIVYHFHDTSSTARIKQTGDLHENDRLEPDAGNLAAFLYMLHERHSRNYELIRSAVRRIFPRFKDFALRPSPLNLDKIRLEWQEHGSDYRFGPHQLSDGTLRFIGLATLLLQPNLPSTILIDEPELGLHPSALTLLAGMVRSASSRAQLILTTQSVSFLNEFEPEDIITIERRDSTAPLTSDSHDGLGESVFSKHDGKSLKEWLNAYSLGELWEMNVLGGRP
ncbi:MAG: AAA family ATPase [Rhodothermaceae bacterium]|nr:AAA family ATPase [Rhodothermaceae bacterium]